MRQRLAKSRFNPAPGVADFWNEFRKPNPWRIPILLASMAPFGLIFLWLSGETLYKDPERPSITYITTFDPARSDADIIASNEANQEVKELRDEAFEDLAERKRELYKALGAAAGMDVEEIERRAQETRKAEAAEREAQLAELMGRAEDARGDGATDEATDEATDAASDAASDEGDTAPRGNTP